MDQANQPNPTPNPPAQEPQPAPTSGDTTNPPAQPAPATAPTISCKCPIINAADWDKKRQKLNKVFHKTFSPRLFFYPFSFVIDIDRATRGAQRKGYKVVENGMILDTGGMFWGSVMVEVTGANLQDSDIVSFENKEVYTKVSRSPWSQIKTDIDALTAELGSAPLELYIWWTSCPKCVTGKDVKAILIAVTAQAIPQQATPTQIPAQPQAAPTTPPAEPQQPATTPAQPEPQQPTTPEPPAQAQQPPAPPEQSAQNPPQG